MVRFLLTSLLVLATTVPAAAQDDASVDADETIDLVGDVVTTVDVVPGEQAMIVTQVYEFVNRTRVEAFTGFFETLPSDAVDVTASSDGRELSAVGIPARDGFSEWRVQFPTPLEPDESREVVLTWRRDELASDPNQLDLVSSDVVAIAPYGVDHFGARSVEVIVPGDFEVVDAEGFVVQHEPDRVVLSFDGPEGYVALPVVLEAPDRFAQATVAVADSVVTIATANGPAAWITDDFEAIVSGLEPMIPLSAPPAMEFRQGYTGDEPWRVAQDGAVVLPFSADALTAARVFADEWLGALDFADADLRAAFAGALADRVAARLGEAVTPRTGGWTSSLDALISITDSATIATVVTALDAGVPAYPGTDDDFVAAPVDWRRLTDVFEHIGGVSAATPAMRLSATPEQVALLGRRETALADYRALADRAAPWAMPPLLRDAMAAWDFDTFAAEQGAVSDLVLARDEMATVAADVGLEIGPYVQTRFERSETSVDGAWELLVEQRETLVEVGEALRLDVGDRGLLSALGMWGRDADETLATIVNEWDAGEFGEAHADAAALIEDYESSVGRGTLRLLVPLAAVSALALVVQALRRRRIQPEEAL